MNEDGFKGFLIGGAVALLFCVFMFTTADCGVKHSSVKAWSQVQSAMAVYQEAQINEDTDRKIAAVYSGSH